jgi:hypothetical protein
MARSKERILARAEALGEAAKICRRVAEEHEAKHGNAQGAADCWFAIKDLAASALFEMAKRAPA